MQAPESFSPPLHVLSSPKGVLPRSPFSGTPIPSRAGLLADFIYTNVPCTACMCNPIGAFSAIKAYGTSAEKRADPFNASGYVLTGYLVQPVSSSVVSKLDFSHVQAGADGQHSQPVGR